MSANRLSLRLFLTVVFATVVAAYALTVALPHNPYIRYQQFKDTIFERLAWIYERVHFDPTPIDIAFIGSSRTEAGVASPLLEKYLSEGGRELKVVNLSIPSSGMDIRYAEARELLQAKQVKLLVIAVVEAFPRDGHQAYGDLETAGEIFKSPLIVNRNLPKTLARLPVRQIDLFVKSIFPQAFSLKGDFDGQPSAEDPAYERPETSDLSPEEHAKALAEETARRKREIRWPILPENFRWVEYGVSRTYIERIAELAKDNGTELAFLFLPFYNGYDAPLEMDWLQEFGPVWIADFIKDNPENYRDAAHVKSVVTDSVARWLAGKIDQLLLKD